MGEAAFWRELEKIKAQIYRWLLAQARYDGMLPYAYEFEDEIVEDLRLQAKTVSLVLTAMHEDGTLKNYSRTSPLGYRHGYESGLQLAGADRRPAMRAEWQRSPHRKRLRCQIASGLHVCATCETRDDLTIDHVVPIDRGGNNEPENLQILCRGCNSRKGTKVVVVESGERLAV